MDDIDVKEMVRVANEVIANAPVPAMPVSVVWPQFAMFAMADLMRRGIEGDTIIADRAAIMADLMCVRYHNRFGNRGGARGNN